MTVKILGTFEKQPAEVLAYDVDYSEWFGTGADTPASFTVATSRVASVDLTPPDPSLNTVSSQLIGKVVKAVLGGGLAGEKYKVRVLLTTNAGLVKEAEFFLKLKEV